MKKYLRASGIVAIGFAVLAVAPRGAHADIIFNDFGTGDAFDQANAYPVSGSSTGSGSTWVAASFTPSANSTLTEIDIALLNGPVGGTNGATVELVNNSPSGPGTTVLESWALTGLPPQASSLGPADMLASSGPAVHLVSGTQYWVVALPADTTTFDGWSFNSTGKVGSFAESFDDGVTWQISSSATPAFDVLGTPTSAVPLPATLPLFAGGLGVLGLLHWRRKRKA